MKTKFKSQRKGAVLMTVTVVSAMMVVIIMAATQLVAHTSDRTNKEYRKKQAYYVASSCLRAFVAETTGFRVNDATQDDTEIIEKINQLKRIAASGQTVEVDIQRVSDNKTVGDAQPRWQNATCELHLEYTNPTNPNEDSLKAIATATYLGQTKTVVAYLSCKTLKSHTYTPRALEIIGTNGGGGMDGKFNNMQVYGSVGASDTASHDYNTVYKFNWNDNTVYGDTDINGSLSIQNQNNFTSNPYYCPGVDESKGCVLNVSRTLMFNANQPHFNPKFSKGLSEINLNPLMAEYNYNYVNALEAVIMGSENANVGFKDSNDGVEYSVDVHAGYFYIGPRNKFDNNMKAPIAETNPDPDDYWYNLVETASTPWGTGNRNVIYGNVYTHKTSNAFNGDMVISSIHNNIYGDIYLDGDLYLDGSPSEILDNIGKIHLRTDENGVQHHIYKGSRVYDKDNDQVIKPADSQIIDSQFDYVVEDWHNVPRSNQPKCPLLYETPYYYYPEHLMCHQGGAKNDVSTIDQIYREAYKADSNGNLLELDTNKVKNVREFSNKDDNGGYKKEFTDDDCPGAVFKPDYVVDTNLCYIDQLSNETVLIDVDAAKSDVVVILKDGGRTSNVNLILVKNTQNVGQEGAHFCYFVSDSGVGTTRDDYGESGAVSTYDHSTFKTPTFTFGGTREFIMDLTSFLHTDCFTESANAKGMTGSLNPTENTDPTRYPGYKIPSNNIIMLFTQGSTFKIDESNMIIQASVYMPRATYICTNRGYQCKIDPEYSNGYMESLNIIGNLVCNEYQISGNRNTIVYNEVSPYSMLAYIKGNGDEHATKSFMLDHYAAS